VPRVHTPSGACTPAPLDVEHEVTAEELPGVERVELAGAQLPSTSRPASAAPSWRASRMATALQLFLDGHHGLDGERGEELADDGHPFEPSSPSTSQPATASRKSTARKAARERHCLGGRELAEEGVETGEHGEAPDVAG
jgi:hypothetical protein